MTDEKLMTDDEMTAAQHLTFVANGLAYKFGAPEAVHLLWAAALSLALANMTRADVVAYLNETAAKLEAEGAERAN